MNAFADYTYYTGTYLGSTIPQEVYPGAALQASYVLDAMTFGRATETITEGTDTDLIDKIKMATCAIAEGEYKISLQANGTGVIKAEKLGNYSIDYQLNQETNLSPAARASAKAKFYLGETGLLYRGFDD